MRKSLGSKRREIPEVARKEIIRIYADMLNGNGECGEFSKTFDTTDFGYREVRVERPLRLNFQAVPERIERLKAEKAFLKLDANVQTAIQETLGSRLPSPAFTNREQFDKALAGALKAGGIKIGAPVRKAILTALSERDEGAGICTDRNGNPEPDTNLRDHELVPLKETGASLWSARSNPSCPMPGWMRTTATRAMGRSAASVMRSTSTGTSIATCRRVRSKKSTPS